MNSVKKKLLNGISQIIQYCRKFLFYFLFIYLYIDNKGSKLAFKAHPINILCMNCKFLLTELALHAILFQS